MAPWRLRDFHEDDLDQAIYVWDESRNANEPHPVFPLSEVISAARSGQPAVVAVVGDEIVGVAAAQPQGERAWISLFALRSLWRNRGIGSALLDELEIRLRTTGVRRISALLPTDAAGTAAMQNSGYSELTGLSYFEKVDHVGAADAGLLASLGGRVMPFGLWQSMAGMETEKQIIERRIVLPLVEPNTAAEYGVSPPKAVILFGPPGTGKTSFAKAVAGRLGWPFVELFPSRLATPDVAMASALREAFATLMELEAAVVFIDEVEEIAGCRSGVPSDPSHGVTNELLKLIPAFRQHDERLLVCATNSVRSLDSAFSAAGPVRLRHSDRSAGFGGPGRDLESLSGSDGRVGGDRQARRGNRDVHACRYRIRCPQGRPDRPSSVRSSSGSAIPPTPTTTCPPSPTSGRL